jgi:hypothetical protein
MGHDYGPPYTDGMCPTAIKEMEEHDRTKRQPARDIQPVDLLIAVMLAAVLTQYAYICKQDERLQHLREIAAAMPLDSRAENGKKPCEDCITCFRKNDTKNPDCAHCIGCTMWERP